MKPTGRPPAYTGEELAVAYELHCEGIPWKRIAQIFGDGIRFAVNHAIHHGIKRT